MAEVRPGQVRPGEERPSEIRLGFDRVAVDFHGSHATSRPAGQPEGPPGLESNTEMRARSRTPRTVIDMQQTPAPRAHPEDRVEPDPFTLRGRNLPSRFQ